MNFSAVGLWTAVTLWPSLLAAQQPPSAAEAGERWSVSGEVRFQYERFANEEWGSTPDDKNGYLLQRFILGTRRRVNSRLSAYLELKSGIETGRAGGPRAADRDELDLHQAYADINTGRSTLRIGRQELMFGSARLVSNRDLNVRQSFDGFRWTTGGRLWRLDVLGAAPARTVTGVFDDGLDHTRAVWGAYAVRSTAPTRGVDLYYLGYRNATATFDDATGKELRHSIGARFWGTHRSVEYNTELVGQWGAIGGSSIRAWTVASQTGYWFSKRHGGQVSVRADVTSGDATRDDGSVETFNPLFPRGSYFGLIASAGPRNHIDLHPQIEWRPAPRGLITVGWLTYWRTEPADGTYANSGRLLRSGLGTQSRLVGMSPNLTLRWDQSRNWSFLGHVSTFTAGPFIQESGGGDRTLFVRLAATYRFVHGS